VLCIAYGNFLVSQTHAAALLVVFPSHHRLAHRPAWLTALPCEPVCVLPPQVAYFVPCHRLHLLPLYASRCGPPGCGREVDAFGDHALACARTGLLARKAKMVERACNVCSDDPAAWTRRLWSDASRRHAATLHLCWPCHARATAALCAERRKRAALGAKRRPPTTRERGRRAVECRCGSISVQQAVASTALGSAWPGFPQAIRQTAPKLERVPLLPLAPFPLFEIVSCLNSQSAPFRQPLAVLK